MIQRFSLVLCVLAALAGALPIALEAQMPSGFEAAWQAVASDHKDTLDSAGVVGGTLAFIREGEVEAVQYFGLEDLESNRPVDERTLYHWASITKTFTAVAVMQLRDGGLLDLDDSIVDYVPELRGVYNPHGSMEEVTLRHLLSHSAGFRSSTWPWGGDKAWHPHEPTEWSQLVAMMPYTEILFPPGSRFNYSNPGVIFLGRTIEQLSGDIYETYINKNIFEVLGMASAYFDITPRHRLENRSNNYRVMEGKPVAEGPDFNTGITVSNGGLNGTVGDLATWMGFLMGAPTGSAKSRGAVHDQVLSRGSLEEMWQPVVSVADSSSLGRTEMGLSFFLYERDGHRLVGHTGSQKSFRSFIILDPATRVGLIGAYNTAGGDDTAPDTDAIRDWITRRGVEDLFPLFSERSAYR